VLVSLGNEATEEQASRRLANSFPEYDFVWTALGLTLFDDKPAEAQQAFEKAISLSSELVWPYYMLTYLNLKHGRLGEALDLATRGLSFARAMPIRSELFEWAGIASALMGRPTEEVDRLFSSALDASPKNPRVLANRDIFHQQAPANTSMLVAPPSGSATLEKLMSAVSTNQLVEKQD
jgi:hypothetical protein